MSSKNLTLEIKYYIKEGRFEIGGNVNREGIEALVGDFLRDQIGAGVDESKPNERDDYSIRLRWYPENDLIEVSSNTGNKGLRDGILMRYLRSLNS